MSRFRLPLIVFLALLVLELGLLAFVDTTTDSLERTGNPFLLRDVPAGASISQRLEVSADGLDGIDLDGDISAGAGTASLKAELVEIQNDGSDIGVVRRATVQIAPAETDCCVVRFDPVADSRWKAYRLDVQVGELNGRHLSLWAAPGPVNGRLVLNGRRQSAFLLFKASAAEGTGLGRLKTGSAGRNGALVALALLFDAIIAATAQLLATASDLRRA